MTRIKSLVQPEQGYKHRIHRKKRKTIDKSKRMREARVDRKKKLEKLRLKEII